ncbi:MAG: carbohydrate kinase family protein [Kiritimatiellae bacterium]|nr:carbohydrate kinase family protein [Kiritimatiellia bacterium]MDD5520064.1 carbohydrate kinase family protein [Kiritimatiellia bacterium]
MRKGKNIPRINCIGVLVVDALSGPLPQYPVPRKHPQEVTKSIRFAAGGGAANTASALARMGLQTGVFSTVGDDSNGSFLLKELNQAGVDTRGVRTVSDTTTPFTFVGVHPDGDRTFIHTPGTNLKFNRRDINLESLFTAGFILYNDCWVLPQLDGKPGAGILAEAQRRGIKTALDECWGLGPKRETLETMLPYCDYFLPSVDDLRVIYPGMKPRDMIKHILRFGVKTVVLKMGKTGCLVATEDDCMQVRGLPAKVVDTTGAGDCWNAGFLAALAHGEDVPAAALIGHACAAYCIEYVGGSSGIPVYSRVVKRAGKLR